MSKAKEILEMVNESLSRKEKEELNKVKEFLDENPGYIDDFLEIFDDDKYDMHPQDAWTEMADNDSYIKGELGNLSMSDKQWQYLVIWMKE